MDIIIPDKYGKLRKHAYVACNTCKCLFLKRLDFITRRPNYNHYCSVDCSRANLKPNSKILVNCAYCNDSIYRTKSSIKKSKSGLVFCNRKCKENAQKIGGIKEIQPNHYGTASIIDYRKLAFEMLDPKCNKCGYNKYVEVLEVHHIDKNRENNNINNLEFLCPTCHREFHFLDISGVYSLYKRAYSLS